MSVPTDGVVFLSHSPDLSEYPAVRSFVQAATDAVLRASLRPVDKGQFTAASDVSAEAASELKAEYCKHRARECDVYLGLIGFRYGSYVPDRADHYSYTEVEFLASTRARILRIIFFLHEEVPLPSWLLDVDRRDIDAFRKRLLDSDLIVRLYLRPRPSARSPTDRCGLAPGRYSIVRSRRRWHLSVFLQTLATELPCEPHGAPL